MKFAFVCAFCVFMVSCGSEKSAAKLDGSTVEARRDRYYPRSSERSTGYTLEENDRFPIKPDPTVTPGDLCQNPDALRYRERIKYCNRSVDSDVKAEIFVTYDKMFGYQTGAMNRSQFKIDHLIPLCMGGSNTEANLWPQHQAVYEFTDPIEPYLCDRMAEGRLTQAEAVQIIREVKQAPDSTDARMQELERR